MPESADPFGFPLRSRDVWLHLKGAILTKRGAQSQGPDRGTAGLAGSGHAACPARQADGVPSPVRQRGVPGTRRGEAPGVRQARARRQQGGRAAGGTGWPARCQALFGWGGRRGRERKSCHPRASARMRTTGRPATQDPGRKGQRGQKSQAPLPAGVRGFGRSDPCAGGSPHPGRRCAIREDLVCRLPTGDFPSRTSLSALVMATGGGPRPACHSAVAARGGGREVQNSRGGRGTAREGRVTWAYWIGKSDGTGSKIAQSVNE